MDDNNQNQIEELDENHLIQVRKEKLKALIEAGKNPYEITEFNRSHVTTEIRRKRSCNCWKNNGKENNGKGIFCSCSRSIWKDSVIC